MNKRKKSSLNSNHKMKGKKAPSAAELQAEAQRPMPIYIKELMAELHADVKQSSSFEEAIWLDLDTAVFFSIDNDLNGDSPPDRFAFDWRTIQQATT